LAGLIIILCQIPAQFSSVGIVRAQNITFLTKVAPDKAINQLIAQIFDHLDPTFLFFNGDQIGRHSTRELGMMYHFDLFLVVIGLIYLFKQHKKLLSFLLIWLVIGVLPAAMAEPSPHALRSLNSLPVWLLFSAFGMNQIITLIRSRVRLPLRLVLYTGLGMISIFSLFLFLGEYYLRYPKNTALDWSNGLEETVNYLSTKEVLYDRIYLSDQVPLIYLAFYLPIKPVQFQHLIQKDVAKHPVIDKISYFSYSWEIPKGQPGRTLIIAPFWQKPGGVTAIDNINLINGDALFAVWEADAG
jgi:hypothetical protein